MPISQDACPPRRPTQAARTLPLVTRSINRADGEVRLVDTHGAGDAFIGALMVAHAGPQAAITPQQVARFLVTR